MKKLSFLLLVLVLSVPGFSQVKKTPKKAPAPRRVAPTPPPKPVAAPVVRNPATVQPRKPTGYAARGPLDLFGLFLERRAVLTNSKLVSGEFEDIVDGNQYSAVQAEGKQAFWQVVLDRPRAVDQVDVFFAGDAAHRWSLLAADTAEDMRARRGSFRALVLPRTPQAGQIDQATLPRPSGYRVYRLECERTSGDGGVQLGDWSLWSTQELTELEVQTFIPVVAVGGRLPLRANGRFDAGARENMSLNVTWDVAPPGRARVDELGRLEGLQPGPVRVTAIHQGLRSRTAEIDVTAEGRPDWDVTYIERQPRVELDAPGGELKPGQNVYWFAHVKNYGSADAESVPIEWRVDGQVARTGRLGKLERFAQTEAIFSTKWDGQRHEVELVVDPQGEVAETSETNNALKVYTDALSVGFWVEESTVRHFHRHQRDLGAGGNSWEDWAQRQVAFWNEAMAGEGAQRPAALSARDRWRLDRIIIVGDGMLPLAPAASPGVEPDSRDRTVHLTLGFPAYNPLRSSLYKQTADKSPQNPFFIQTSLLDTLGRVRFYPPTPR